MYAGPFTFKVVSVCYICLPVLYMPKSKHAVQSVKCLGFLNGSGGGCGVYQAVHGLSVHDVV